MVKLRGAKKVNPERICLCCGNKILDKFTNSIYCKDCSKVIKEIMAEFHNLMYAKNMRKKFPHYYFIINLKIIKRRYTT